MKKTIGCLILLMLSCTSIVPAVTAMTTFYYTVPSITELSFSTESVDLTVNSATAGSPPDTASVSSTYAITTNNTGLKIYASLNTNALAGTTLSIYLGAPLGASSTGAQPLSMIPTDLVTGISNAQQSTLNVTYTMSALITAVPNTAPVTVTYTLGP